MRPRALSEAVPDGLAECRRVGLMGHTHFMIAQVGATGMIEQLIKKAVRDNDNSKRGGMYECVRLSLIAQFCCISGLMQLV